MRGAAAGAALAASAAALLTAAYGGGPRPSSPPAAAGGAAEAQNGNSGGGREERSRAAGRAEPRNSSAGCTVTGPELCTRCGVGAAAWPLVTCTAAHCLLPPACPVQGASPLDCADTDRPDTAARSLFGSSALGDAGGEKSDAARCAELARSSGVLRIRSGDGPAAFATTFFEYLVNQLVFAERWNLSPWLDFDPRVATRVADPPPAPRNAWLAFLQPIGPYRPGLRCGGAPWDGTVVTLGYRYMHRFLHVSEQWAVRGWPYDGSPEWVSRYRADRLSAWDPEYYGAKRRLGARVVRDYFRWRPQVKARAAAAWAELFPRPAAVLGMHFRGTDKGNGRRQVTPSEFLPYAAGWARARGAAAGLLIASDCSAYVAEALRDWPPHLRAIARVPNATRSATSAATFQLPGQSKLRLGLEVLTDIMLLARCDYFLYGASMVAEAVFYLSPRLHGASVNLEYCHGRARPTWADPPAPCTPLPTAVRTTRRCRSGGRCYKLSVALGMDARPHADPCPAEPRDTNPRLLPPEALLPSG
eukprot:TRINITY_DN15793_c1_g1_i4.p1 TRINITY_DN15793_c1_g1~~TRINITY_DN15793_c1_g1_i4.p1  ORF type:complete len:554 (+),score=150.71 TRINITY_DN15793_c1_g1_i4:72-1664(+)